MKKIFAISVLSLLAVVATGDCAFAVRSEPFFTAGRVDQAIRKATNGMLTHEDIISPNETSTSPDYDAPSVSRMENTVDAAVATKVDNEQIIKANGTTTLAGTTVDAASLNKDTVAPTIANVEANFVPQIATTVYNRGDVENIVPGSLPIGAYSLIIEVQENNKVVFRWVALDVSSHDDKNSTCSTTGCMG